MRHEAGRQFPDDAVELRVAAVLVSGSDTRSRLLNPKTYAVATTPQAKAKRHHDMCALGPGATAQSQSQPTLHS